MRVDELLDMATGYWKSAALTAAVELGIFEALSEKPRSGADLAEQLGTDPGYTEELLNALAGMGLTHKSDEGFVLVPELRPFLSPGGAMCLIEALRFNADLYPLWGRLAESVRAGKPVLPEGAHLGGDPERTRHFVEGMHSRALLLASQVIPALDLTGCRTVLDVGAGPGTFSVRLLERYPELEATLFDLPPVLDVARALHAGNPMSDRLRYFSGDYHTGNLPSDFDAILFIGALHQEPREVAREILSKIHSALRAGGRLFLVDLLLERDRTQPIFSALFSLNMMLMRDKAGVYTLDDATELVRKTGFREIAAQRLDDSPYGLVRAIRA